MLAVDFRGDSSHGDILNSGRPFAGAIPWCGFKERRAFMNGDEAGTLQARFNHGSEECREEKPK